eukprot:SAG11_NODE_2102_length_3820_cov_2.233808_1_plen_53_part_00
MKEELIKALGPEVRQEYGRAKDQLEADDPMLYNNQYFDLARGIGRLAPSCDA